MRSAFKDFNIRISKNEVTVTDTKRNWRYTAPFNLTYDSFVKWLSENVSYKSLYGYGKKNTYTDNSVENIEIPYIGFCFYLYLVRYNKVPTMDDLINEYMRLYMVDMGQYVKIKESLNGSPKLLKREFVEGRIYRSYGSFIREIAALLLAMEVDDGAYYDFQKDLNGIDICFPCQKGIATFVASKRSFSFRNKKETIRHKFSIEMLSLPAYIFTDNANYNCIDINGIQIYEKEKTKKIIEDFLRA